MCGTKTLPTWRCSPERYIFVTVFSHACCSCSIKYQGARLREKSENETNEEEEEDAEDEEDIDEELGYISPLENVNPYVSFKQALTSVFLAFPCMIIS